MSIFPSSVFPRVSGSHGFCFLAHHDLIESFCCTPLLQCAAFAKTSSYYYSLLRFLLPFQAFCHRDAKVTSTENWYQRSDVIAVTKPEYVVLTPLKIAWKRCWKKNSEKLNGQNLKCYKHSLEESSGRCLKIWDGNVKMGSKDCSQDVSKGERASSELNLKLFVLNSINNNLYILLTS